MQRPRGRAGMPVRGSSAQEGKGALPVRAKRQALPGRAAVRALPEAFANTTRVDGLWTSGSDLDDPNVIRVETQLRPGLAAVAASHDATRPSSDVDHARPHRVECDRVDSSGR